MTSSGEDPTPSRVKVVGFPITPPRPDYYCVNCHQYRRKGTCRKHGTKLEVKFGRLLWHVAAVLKEDVEAFLRNHTE